MSFPVSPLDGQSAIVNNILYTYNQTYNTWTRVPGTTVLGGVSNTDGVLMWNTANAAFGVANTANSLSRGAFSLANTTATTVSTQTGYINVIYPKVNAAFIQANTSFDRANGAFAAANAAGSSSTVIAAFDTANSAYGQANTNATNITSVGNFANGAFTAANSAATSATNAAVYANGAFTQANTATSTATLAFGQANAAFNTANTKTYVFYQSTAPTTANVRDSWINSDSGIRYENLNGTTPLWVELGPTTAVSESPIASAAFDKANTAITTSGGSITGRLNVAYTSAGTGYAVSVSAANTQGGTGFADFLKVTNTSGGATNSNKSFRMNSTGAVEIINSAYTATLFNLSDTGNLSISGDYQVSGKKAVNGPTFSAYRNSAQTIATDVQASLQMNTVEYDTNSCYSTSTYRFTPNVEGYYNITAGVRFDGDIGTGERMITLWKNGAEYKRAFNSKGSASVGTNWFQMTLDVQVYANGSTDYFEIKAQHGAGVNLNTTAGTPFTYFQGCMMRGA